MLSVVFSSFTSFAYIGASDLKFRPEGKGYFIYENNVESVRREDLSDDSNENPTYIMKNTSLYKAKYSVFITNLNFTGVKDENSNFVEKGFDIEVDGLFKAEEDSVIKITSLGFEMPDVKTLYQRGNAEKYEESWSCLEAWASYLKMPIKQIDSYKVYEPVPFDEVTFSLKKGETKWISEYIKNYDKVPYLKPVNILMDFEVVSGKTEFDIAALKSTGKLKDRSHHCYDAADGKFTRERQYKGVADTLPKMNTTLRYTITDKAEEGEKLPVRIYNQYNKAGKYSDKWVTNLNPQNDRWSYDLCAESDMIVLKYKDPTKLNYYGSGVRPSQKDDIWYFDVFHADNTEPSDDLSGKNKDKYVPNKTVSVKEQNYLSACNLGNYGVRVNYKMEIYNNTDEEKYAYYKLATGSNNIVILYDENQNPVNDYAICKGVYPDGTEHTMACVKLLPKKQNVFYLDVILPANCNGGMLNYFEIHSSPYEVKFAETDMEFVKNKFKTDGTKILKWDDNKLYASDDFENYYEIKLSDEAKKIFANEGNNFDIVKTDNGYMAKWSAYDGAPSYFGQVLKFYDTIYLFDEDFNLLKTKKFENYPTDIKFENGIYYVTAGKTYYSKDFENFFELTTINAPVSNKTFEVSSTKYGNFFIKTEDMDYTKLEFSDNMPKYVSSCGKVFYYTDKNNLYISPNAVYWTKFDMAEDIKTIDCVTDKFIVNGEKEVKIPSFEKDIILNAGGKIISTKNKPFDIDGCIMVPVNDIFANADISLKWDESYKNAIIQKMYTNINLTVGDDTALVNGEKYKMGAKAEIINDELYVPLDLFFNKLGFNVNYNPLGNIIDLRW